MTRIEASEDCLARANSYFILAWVVTAVVMIAAFVDFRAYTREVAVNERQLTVYSKLETGAAQVARKLRSAVYLAPDYADEQNGIEAIRRLRSEVVALVKWIAQNHVSKSSDLTLEDRKLIQPAINFMHQMLLLNDATTAGYAPIKDEPTLALADHTAGSYLTADEVSALRIEDAARYLWLSSLELRRWHELLNTYKSALSHDDPQLDGFAAAFAPIIEEFSTDSKRDDRSNAQALWITWLKSTSINSASDARGKDEARRRVSLTLAQTSEFLEQALAKKSELDRLAGGEGSTVEIPVLSMPLQLRDALIVSPWILAFCGLSIINYIGRALRFFPNMTNKNEVVGNAPGFCVAYGAGSVAGVLAAFILLLLPSVLMVGCVLLWQPILLTSLDEATVIFISGIVFYIMSAVITSTRMPRLLKLINPQRFRDQRYPG